MFFLSEFAISVFTLFFCKQLSRKLLIEFFEFLIGRMGGKMNRYGNAKKKNYFKDADHIISNNFETKHFHPPMDGRLRFPQVSTHSPLFYASSTAQEKGSTFLFKTFEV